MTPLFKKLNLGDIQKILVLQAPESFDAELARLEGLAIVRRTPSKPSVSFGIGFAITQAELDDVSSRLAKAALGDAIVWVAYPKGTSKRYRCEFNRDNGWHVLGQAGFEPVRQVAIDDDWSALRFRRTEFIKTLTRRQTMAISSAGKKRTRVN
ncbi:MAG: hypothetical protein KDA60_12600 [Planctomycetales bacterium]|nr:hypothetical protein [Planctomycetales bacterium]